MIGKFFWNDIGAFVFRSLYFAYETGHFSQFQTQGVITCIPKENKDRRYMSNWMNTISCNIVPVQIEFLIVLKYDYLFH
jgi:hypothetical protein